MNSMQHEQVTLNQILEWLDLPPVKDVTVRELVLDSRKVMAGDLFLALPGLSSDGRQYIEQAVAAGACAVLAEADDALPESAVPIVSVANLKDRLSGLVSRFYRSPSEYVKVIGVTGTNGKSSCCHFIAQLLSRLNASCGVMGTLGNGIFPDLMPAGNTTSDNLSVQQFMAGLVDKSVPWLTMEVSSHGLHQGRVSGIAFNTAMYTNLSRDHLDYHQTMEAYASAKAELFRSPGLQHAVINFDDEWADLMLNVAAENQVNCITYSICSDGADIWLSDIVFSPEGMAANIHTPWGEGRLCTALLGKFSLSNLLAVIGVLCLQGFALERILTLIPELDNVPGRLERLGGASQPTVVVDYAHTPDALRSVLGALRDHGGQTVTCVFGCGGDRDSGKRPLMTEAALTGADRVVLTSDNPRTEDPLNIIEDAVTGIPLALREHKLTVVPDRAEAIATAVAEAGNEDIVLVAGKGHEDYQEIHGVRYPFSDRREVRQALDRRAAS
ncbi:UDP-N-acetylmuramoyl-L-alanyl-D-glutamate--2,6-diaminopimelate ligase [Kistimonas asteriae]|uniref:UDP-N-acetylmuramoyl-L-alanyl-D-glutamate--2, 6-diaminopimelate ligase n=1 Tax=Kistimonas asteriae TaxID=517724 RepID=UPI001BAAB189|nr:UDP-N-acetylmuramoyl-L-alanyl-D-glutamate--2,6-diaminopimelate ligase [Kistimonas asteriae]